MTPSTTLAGAASARSPMVIFGLGALAELLFGYDLGIIGVALLSIEQDFVLDPFTRGLVVSSILFGATIGVGVAGGLADRLGRKPALVLTGVIFAVSGVAAALAPGVALLIVARMIMGLGVGASAVVVSVYLVEVAPTHLRGRVGAMGQLMVVSGILMAYLVGYALQPFHAWRWMIGLSAIPALVLLIGQVFMPETPRWLVMRDRIDAARQALKTLGRAPREVDAELDELISAHRAGEINGPAKRSVLRQMLAPKLRPASLAAAAVAILVQFIGVNSIIYYAPTTLSRAGFGDAAAVTANLGIGVVNLVFTVIGVLIMDRFSRKRLMSTGALVMLLTMGLLGLHAVMRPEPSMTSAWINLLGMMVFFAAFALSWGVCVRVVISELFPSSIRGTAAGLILVLNWLANFVVGQAFPSLLDYSASLSFFIFAGVGIVAWLFVRLYLPETGSGRSLEDIQQRTA
ncbi:sugar porter family MFS transporter [Modicisalibacter radicis]|uniref:sugar porter family MFS transporter n=1 Tax=Halomonas sp. EAR18 TaxID=2518972 RepID=UPI00109D394F|nr:sugar porter family MFS transporter [Halomonas sp. EAR18]